MHRQKPERQRQLRRLEDRTGSDRRLIAARLALPVLPPVVDEGAVMGFPAMWADKAIWPARRHQRRVALFHHDPSHHDEFLDGVSADASRRCAEVGLGTVFTAYEGLRVTLGPAGQDPDVALNLRDLCPEPHNRRAAIRLSTNATAASAPCAP